MKIMVAMLLALSSSFAFAGTFEIRRITLEDFNGPDSTRQDCAFAPGSLDRTLSVYGTTEKRWDAVNVTGDIEALFQGIVGAAQPDHATGDHFVNYWLFADGQPARLLRAETNDGVVVDACPNAAKLVRILNRLCD